MSSTYSGSHLRERDQIIQEKHDKEMNALQNKMQKVKYYADDIAKDLFDCQNRGRRLAEALGFQDTYDAQVAIDSSEYTWTYRECLEHLQIIEAQLSVEKKEMQALEGKLREVERENKKITMEKRELEERFDDMRDKFERVSDLYKRDFKKWRATNQWLFGDAKASRKHQNGFGATPQKEFGEELLQRKRERVIELGGGPDIPEDFSTIYRQPAPLVHQDISCDKENEGTPIPLPKTRRAGSENSAPPSKSSKNSQSPANATPPVPLRNSLLNSVTNIVAPSASQTVFLNNSRALNISTASMTRVPLSFQPIPDTILIPEPSYTLSPINTTISKNTLHNLAIPHMPDCSSDTEDDSQAVPFPSKNPRTGKPMVFKVPAPPPKAGASRLNENPNNTPHPSLPSRPIFPQTSPERKRNLAIAEPMRKKEHLQLMDRDRESGRPVKMRRLSENDSDRSRISLLADSSSTSTSAPRPRLENFSSKGKDREIRNDTSTPLTTRSTGQKLLEDYSAFKGRGRYGKATQDANQTTINALYTINPARNGGLAYQYDEVVRSKEARRKMDAGDCECCREYYESVGPLPSRLQQPLWRSPPATPAKPCPDHSHSDPLEDRQVHTHTHPSPTGSRSLRRRSDIESHKKAISRHRHTWARATTPPGYWNIGFPNTQEVGDINEKAQEMHKRKKDEVNREAASEGGRYRRK